jgi:serine protease Do
MPNRRLPRPTAVALLLACLLAAAPSARAAGGWDPARATAPDTLEELKALQATVKKVVDKVTPATVAILLPNGGGSYSVGSGVIVSPDGLVMTAAHVIEDPAPRFNRARTVMLILSDGTRAEGVPLGRNPANDSGLVRITTGPPKGGAWPYAEVGDSAAMKPGQWVVLMGHPGGPRMDESGPGSKLVRKPPVRVGQVLGTHRDEDDPPPLRSSVRGKKETPGGPGVSFLVSDCTIVGGDSGGPLFDLSGKVVGINSQIRKSLTKNLHVPAKAFKDEWSRLVRGDVVGEESPAVLGVQLNRAGKGEPKLLKVQDGQPADDAGLKAGDLILKFNGEAVGTSDEVDQIMSGCRPGQTVTLEVQRGDEVIEVKVKLGRRDRRAERENRDAGKDK